MAFGLSAACTYAEEGIRGNDASKNVRTSDRRRSPDWHVYVLVAIDSAYIYCMCSKFRWHVSEELKVHTHFLEWPGLRWRGNLLLLKRSQKPGVILNQEAVEERVMVWENGRPETTARARIDFTPKTNRGATLHFTAAIIRRRWFTLR